MTTERDKPTATDGKVERSSYTGIDDTSEISEFEKQLLSCNSITQFFSSDISSSPEVRKVTGPILEVISFSTIDVFA